MPWRAAKSRALSGVFDATATSSLPASRRTASANLLAMMPAPRMPQRRGVVMGGLSGGVRARVRVGSTVLMPRQDTGLGHFRRGSRDVGIPAGEVPRGNRVWLAEHRPCGRGPETPQEPRTRHFILTSDARLDIITHHANHDRHR